MLEYPLINFKGRIHLVNSNSDLQSLGEKLKAATEFGFDTETRPSFKKGEIYKVALLQLATDNDAFLIRLQRLSEFTILQSIFENEQILKVGVAIRDDLKQLQKIFKFNPKNFIELQEVAKQKGLNNFGLKGMTEEVLQARLSKAAKITNWEAQELTEKQMLYAATDAWVGLELYRKITVINS